MKLILSTARLAVTCLCAISLISFSCGNEKTNNKPASAAPKPSFGKFISEKQFDELFPQRDQFYTYQSFIKAVDELARIKMRIARRAESVYQFTRTDERSGKAAIIRQDGDWNEDWAKVKPDSVYSIDYGDFCTGGDTQMNRRELAAFFAQIAHETRHGMNGEYRDGLMLRHEENVNLEYLSDSDEYPPVKGQKYYGRGPMQLSYNGNYGYASDCIFGDKKILLNNPALVETDPVVAFKTAIYFWMTPESLKPSAHDAMTGKWRPAASDKGKNRVPGFGMTINIINGEVECGKGEDVYSMHDRIGFYRYFLTRLKATDPDCACSCGDMEPYRY